MLEKYQHKSFEFRYPPGWDLDESRTQEGETVSLQSPYSMFVFLTNYRGDLEPAAVADQALLTMSEEYERLDSEPIREPIAGVPSVGHDVNFISFDLTNTCWIRALRHGSETLLIFAQTSDLDLDHAEAAFRGICASLKLATGNPDSPRLCD